MKIGEVGLLTNDVIRLATFYRSLLGLDNDCMDSIHQTIIAEETMLTIYNDGTWKENNNKNICLAFTVEDIDYEYQRLKDMGVSIIQPPKKQPWGTTNLCFCDPDGNTIYFRQFPKGSKIG